MTMINVLINPQKTTFPNFDKLFTATLLENYINSNKGNNDMKYLTFEGRHRETKLPKIFFCVITAYW